MLLTVVLIFGLPFAAWLYVRYRRDMISGLGAISQRCSRCDQELPRFRMPKSPKQALLGGWTCSNCGCEVDRHGVGHEG
jgi:hypothetical protein